LKKIRPFIIPLFVILCLIMAGTCLAAEKKKLRVVKKPGPPPVEVHLDVLDNMGLPDPDGRIPLVRPPPKTGLENYIPPPMFGEKPRLPSAATYKTLKPIDSPVMLTREAVMAKVRAIEKEQEETEQGPSPPPQKPIPEEVEHPERARSYGTYTRIIDGTPALPTTGQQAEDNSKPKHFMRNIPQKRAEPDLQANQLVQPTAQDILDSIDVPGSVEVPVADVMTEQLYDAGDERMSLKYQKGAIVAEDEAKERILKPIAVKALETGRRVQILAHASPSREGQATSRRLSLARALGVKDYLESQGIQPKMIDIQPLGDTTMDKEPQKPADRVDIYILDPSNH
jgi:outer membrane protein OmpA-like peptidoglycan-associated protein